MRCFVHNQEEAVAACKHCGKGMCAKCSAYSGHSGICPECRKKEFEKEVISNQMTLDELKWSLVKAWVLTILLFWTVIGLFVGWYYIAKYNNEKQALLDRNAKLNVEIKKLNDVLQATGGAAFL